jgi:hypothetical protein
MRITLSILLASLLFSCSNHQLELEKLAAENDSLTSAINQVTSSQKKLQMQVGLMPMSNKIQLGEEYEAVVFFIVSDKTQPTELTLFDAVGKQKLNDTLVFNSEPNEIPTIKYLPKDTGKFELRGYLKGTVLDEQYELFYAADFEVK